MVLTLDKIVFEVAERTGDHNKERLGEIRRYLQSTVTELTQMLRKGSVLQSAVLSVSNGIVTLPAGVTAVVKIYDTGSVFFESVDNDEYTRRNVNTSQMTTAQVFEDVPYWKIKLLNYTDSTNTITVDYLLTTKNPAILPDYYFELLATGTEAKYHLRRSPREKSQDIISEYEKLKRQFNENQSYNDDDDLVIKGLPEIVAQDPNNSAPLRTQNSYISLGGYY